MECDTITFIDTFRFCLLKLVDAQLFSLVWCLNVIMWLPLSIIDVSKFFVKILKLIGMQMGYLVITYDRLLKRFQ